MVRIKKKLSLLDILISLPADPSGMMRHLLQERRHPPYLILAPLSTLAVIVAPALWYQYSMSAYPYTQKVYYAIAITAVLTFFTFSFFMSVLLKVMLLNVSTLKVLAATLYSLAGLIPFMITFYLGDFLSSGELSVIPFLATGRHLESDWILDYFPAWGKAALCFSFLLFVNAIMAVTNSKWMSALAISILAIPVSIGSFAMALTIADAFFAGTGIEVYNCFTRLLSS